jgi:hypothetical protein
MVIASVTTMLPLAQLNVPPARIVNGAAIVPTLTDRTSVAVVGFWIKHPLRIELAAMAV